MKSLASGMRWRASWPHEGGALAKKKAKPCFKSKFPSFSRDVSTFPKKESVSPQGKREVWVRVWRKCVGTLLNGM
jgi:hypothetical protein